MSLRIIIKDEDRVFAISESDNLLFESLKINKNNTNIWSPKGSRNTLICSVSDANYREYIHEFDDVIAELSNTEDGIKPYKLFTPVLQKIIGKSVDAEIASFKNDKFNTLPFAFVIAQDSEAYLLNCYGTIRELGFTHYLTYFPEYFLSANEELSYIENKVDRVLVSLINYNSHLYTLSFPIMVKDTKSLETKFYYLDDILKLADKYNFGGDR